MAPRCERDREKLARMEQAVRVLIHGLGEDLEREGLRDTPKRVAKALLDCTQGYHQDTSSTLGTALFHEPIVHSGDEGVVLVRDIDFASTSEETLLPFHGRCHVAYRPKDGVVLGLSKLARLAKQYAKRLQTQERLALDIAVALQQSLDCHGVAVVLQARHLCNTARPEERTVACVSGVFATKHSAHLEELLALLGMEDLPAAAVQNLGPSPPPSAAAAAVVHPHHHHHHSGRGADGGVAAPGTPDPSEKDTDGDSDDLILEAPCCCEEMEGAVQQLLAELGEDPHRAGLAGSARRYVMSLLASTSGHHHQQQQQQAQQRRQAQQQQGAQQQQQLHGQQQHQQQRADASGGVGGVAIGKGAEAGQRGVATLCAPTDGADRGSPTVWPGARCASGACGCTSRSSGGGSLGNGASRMEASYEACYAPSPSCKAACAAAVVVPRGASALRGAITLRMPFASQCEHHMLPFYGNLMVSYIPHGTGCTANGAAGGGPELPRGVLEQVVLMYTQRLQVQERITHQVADAVADLLQAAAGGAGRAGDEAAGAAGGWGVMVVCDAAHMCMVARGVENHSGSTTSFAVRGAFAGRPELRTAALRLFREQC